MNSRKIYSAHAVTTPAINSRRAVRKHLNADNLFSLVRKNFQKIPDLRDDNSKISLDDALLTEQRLIASTRGAIRGKQHQAGGVGLAVVDEEMGRLHRLHAASASSRIVKIGRAS